MHKINKKCVFCGESSAETKDHIFSRCLFPKSLPVNYDGYIVPACEECNNSYSLDEEFFRNLITSIGLDSSFSARNLWDTKIKRSVRRNPKLAWSIFEKMELVDHYTANGIYLGKKTKLTIDVEMKRRINRVLTKYTKGLFYKYFNTNVTKEYKIQIGWPEQIKNVEDLLRKIRPRARVGDVLSYGFEYVENTYNSAWLFLFYQKLLFLVLIIHEDNLRDKKMICESREK